MSADIAIWYGPVQRFGHLGRPQRWINVLGTIADPGRAEAATSSVNGGPERQLALGGDLHRLAGLGDFNVELSWEELDQGDNTLVIRAVTQEGDPTSVSVKLVVEKDRSWPLPWAIDFAALGDLQDAVQVVDGRWRLEADGVRTVAPYYDRVLSMGDASWTDYEAVVRLTVHGFTPSAPGPPTYGVTHVGVAMRWRGHHADGLQPSRRWFPLGAQGEFLLGDDTCQWRILFDGTPDKPPAYADGRNTLVLGRPMHIGTQVATMPDGRSRYRFKQWQDSAAEPAAWDVVGFELDDYPSGALCLVPHNADVTIHDVRVEPLHGVIASA